MKLSALIENQILIVMFVFFYEYDIYLVTLAGLGQKCVYGTKCVCHFSKT